MAQAPQQPKQGTGARRDAATDGSRELLGGEAAGLENQNVTRPTPPSPPDENAQKPEREGLENQNITKPGKL